MNFFRHLPIKRKLMVIIMLVSGVASWLVSLSFVTYQQVTYRKQVVQDLSITAAMAGANSTAGLSFNEADSVEQALKSLSAQPGIVRACVYDQDGNPFARYQRADITKEILPPPVQGEGHHYNQNRLELFQPITLAGETVGTIYLEMDLHEMTVSLWRCALIMVLVLLAAGVVAFFLSAWLQKFISEPLSDLAKTVTIVATKKDYSVRAVKPGEDELGRLIDGFNHMLGQIQERDTALQAARDHLEQRIQERTAELAESLSMLNATLGSTADGILVINNLGKKVLQNQRTVDLWKIPPHIAEGNDDDAQVRHVMNTTTEPERFREKVVYYHTHPDKSGQDEIELKDGTILERITAPVLGKDGRNYGRIWTFRGVTERKQAEARLAKSLSLLNATLESTADGILVIDRLGHVVSCNAKFVKMWGLPQEKMAPGQVDDQILPLAMEMIKDSETFLAKVRELYSRPEAESFDVIELKDGRIFERYSLPQWLEGKCVGRVWCFRDATKRKQAEVELAYERDLLRTLLENSPDHIYFKDAQSRFIKSSCAQARQFGVVSPDELVGKTDFNFFTEEHARPAFVDEQEIIRTGQPMIGKIERESWKDGRGVSWVLTTKLPLRNKNGEIIGTFGISKDITPIKEAEARLQEVHKELLETSRRAGMAEVATSVLHNIGNVLNSVNVSATLLVDNTRASKAPYLGKVVALLKENAADLGAFMTRNPRGLQLPDYLGQLAEQLAREQHKAIEELESLRKNIEHIKDIVAMQQNYAKISGVTETVQMSELVEDSLRMNIGALSWQDIELVRDYTDVPPVIVEKHKVLQILVNLIRNAKHACDDSGRKDKQLRIQISQTDDRVLIAVRDNGVGIPAENMTRIFNHGFTTRKRGHGFGLHSGALAAKELGGSLTAQSDGPGAGATFTLELPLQQLPNHE
jgi:PAS domain S-box-containing protein